MRSFLLRTPVSVWIVLAWAIAVLPHLSVRSFIWEEGNNAELARDMLARGDFLEPAIFGLRYVEKPSLLSWLIAGTARLTGTVDEWSARLPAMLSVLGTALLVQRLTRRYASAPAALFAAGAFMFSPLLLRKLTISEPDTLVTFLSFAAFVVWWDGEARGRVTVGRWLACGGLLTALAMAKGPQPIGFFALGVGGYLASGVGGRPYPASCSVSGYRPRRRSHGRRPSTARGMSRSGSPTWPARPSRQPSALLT